MPGTSPYILDRRATTEPGDSASFPFDRVEENRVFEERAVTANMSVQGVKLNDWATRIVALEGGGGAGPTGDAVVFNTLADVALNSIAADVDFIVVGGYADVGDCPPLPLKRVASEPTSHTGKKQSADGAWWEYFPHGPVYLEWFGGQADYHTTPQAAPFTASAVNGSPTDNLAAFNAAVDFLYAYISFVHTGFPIYAAGPTIQFSYGSYYFSDAIQPDRSVCIQGMGHGYVHDGAHTRLYFATGKSGIILSSGAVAPATPVGAAGGTAVRNLYLESLGAGGQTTKHGIVIDIGASVEHCTIRGFGGNGVDITADITGGTNANVFYLNRLAIYSNVGHGVYCQGGDANAGIGIAINSYSNGGWGIRDDSFLGNSWVGCHTAGNTGGPYYLVGVNSRSILIGCYSESDQTGSYIGPNAQTFGGIHAAGFTTLTGAGMVDNAIHFDTLGSRDAADTISVRVRRFADQVLEITAPDATAFSTKYIANAGYGVGATQSSLSSFLTSNTNTVTAGRAESLAGGSVVHTSGAFFGSLEVGHANARLLATSDLNNQTFGNGFVVPHGTYARGDTVYDCGLDLGHGVWGYVCTTTGGVAAAWVTGTQYLTTAGNNLLTYIKTAAGRYYRCTTAPAGLSTVEPSHVSGTVVEADGFGWKFLTSTTAVFKRFAPTMGATTTTVDDPIFSTTQTWNDAAVTFRGHKTNITSTASAAASMLEDWQVSSSTQANIRKDGRIAATASTAPVAGGAQTIQMTSTAGLGVYAGANAPTVSAAKGSLYLRTNGSTTNDRMYVNTDGGTTWTAVTTVA
jgi:hypothetical protein